MLSLGLFKLVFGLLELHGEEFNLLVSHRNGLLRVVADLHEGFRALLHLPFKVFDQAFLARELSFTLLQLRRKLLIILLLKKRCLLLELLERSLGLIQLALQGFLGLLVNLRILLELLEALL